MKNNIYKIVNILLIAFFAVLILLRIFYKLDAIGWQDIDEARHATNAYELFHDGNWIVHTYDHAIDYYNSKPPLYYWLTNIMFALFGINTLTFKLPSAVSGIIICIMMSVFLYRQIKKRVGNSNIALTAVALYLAAFITMDLLYDYHMFRTGNFDSPYTLFMLAGVLCMIRAQKDNRYLIPFGVLAGLAFLSKGFNATVIVFAAICCIPFLAKENRIKYILYSLLAATLTVLPWAALRFKFDGTEFFYNMFFGEATDKVVGATVEYFQQMPQLLTFRLLFYAILIYLVSAVIKHRSLKVVGKELLSDLKEYKVLWVWFWIPILFYSWAGFFNEWYTYPSHILATVLCGIYVARGIDMLGGSKIYVQAVACLALCGMMTAAAVSGINRLGSYWLAGNGGGPALPFWADLRDIKEQYGDLYRGSDVYIEDIDHYVDLDNVPVEEADTTQDLFFDLRAYAEFECDWNCKSGGIDAWEQSEDGILVINKAIFDQYYDRVVGHVIIMDNGYLYFSRDMY